MSAEEEALSEGIIVGDTPLNEQELFPTTTDDVRLKVPTDPHNSIPALSFFDSKPKDVGIPPPVKIPKPKIIYSAEEIRDAADQFLKGKQINLDDEFFVSSVIEELTSRQIELLTDGEYLKSQAILDKITELRIKFKEHDQVIFHQQHIEELKQRIKDSDTIYKDKKREIAEQEQTLLQEQKAEMAVLLDSQEKARYRLENEWQDPAKQRQFNKQSSELLQARSIEMHSALAGDLSLADAYKQKVRKLEKQEANKSYRKMQSAFEAAQNRLEDELSDQQQKLAQQHEQAHALFRANAETELERIKAKNALCQKLLKDELRFSPKAKPSTKSSLPMVNKTVENVTAKNRMKLEKTKKSLTPLQLPPLVIKRKPKRKSNVKTLP